MNLIIILISLILDRMVSRTKHFNSQWYARRYADWLGERKLFADNTDGFTLTLAVLAPVLLTYLLSTSLPGFLYFLLSCFIVFIALRNAEVSHQYHAYRDAVTRNDTEACYLLAGNLLPDTPANNPDAINRAVGRELAFINFRYFAAVIIWFVAFGPTGVVLYALVRDWNSFAKRTNSLPVAPLHTCLEWLDFVPARLTTAIYLFIGDFTRALPIWLKYLTNVSVSSRHVITHVATKAATDSELTGKLKPAPVRYVDLAKRTTKTLIVVVAFLTIIGTLN
ncbi:regulatory signaling modulator protein AmpE [Alteromonas ponticola]|uniref:Regulatory signaling modulator protein AmpE n=1 Tax=Alteromonas ponticola TaxID=2720613 RepID=A0ABX1QY80_9ALTE|nr:regulatory signaling modulator protein AmpE [Alteromonas ponticola]NMH59193.1 regulatory signaling modulator protein AmpE [Alteromonas ponticola]